MNCQIFESHINELSRGRLMEAATREAALAHAERCARCAARLRDERALGAGLHALGAGMRASAAPARVETNLLAAFRAHAAETAEKRVASHASSEAPARVEMSAHSTTVVVSHWSWRKSFGVALGSAAAAALAFVTLMPVMQQAAKSTKPSVNLAQASDPNTRLAQGSQGAPLAAEELPQVARGNAVAQASPNDEASEDGTRGGGGKLPSPNRVMPRTSQMMEARYTPASTGNAAPRRATANNARRGDESEEIATDFIPLVHEGQFAASDSAQVIRVEMPRSALASFGLPVNFDRAGGRVKADVLMGQDGVARAIRFVR